MKRVAILTFHRSINYGAFLQCYSLYKNILNAFDNNIKVEVINYNSLKMELFYLVDILREYRILKQKVEQYNIFRKELHKLELAPQNVMIGISEARFVKFINNNFDAVIVGSDEVWKINYQRSFPNVYWLSDKISIPKFSYAASANRTNIEELSEKDVSEANKRLSTFKYLGVRDTYTTEVIKKINPSIQYVQNPDPVLLYEPDSEYDTQIAEKLNTKGINLKKPIIAILSKNKTLAKNIRDKYSDRFQYISMGQYNSETDAFIHNVSPLEWANTFKFFTLTVTRLYHGTILSMKNNTRFVAVDMEQGYLKYTSKIQDLLLKCDLQERYFNIKSPDFIWDKFLSSIDIILDSPVDHQSEKVFKHITNQRKIFQDSFINKLKEELI